MSWSNHKAIFRRNLTLLMLGVSSCLLTWYLVINIVPSHYHKLSYWNTPVYEKPGSDYFYTDAWGREASHAVLFHDIGDSIENARKADIIFVGNSRLPLSLREEFIVPLAEQAGLKVFSLGVGHGESAEFARRVMRKHKLKPKILVILGGPYAYGPRMSELANTTIALSRWQAISQQIQTRGAWWLRSSLHKLIPNISFPNAPREPGYIIYRSETTGWWHPAVEPHREYPVSYDTSGNKYRQVVPYASQFKLEMDSQDTLMIATIAPYRKTADSHLAKLEQELGIRVVVPALDNLKTTDSSHLNKESAARFSAEFWKQFIILPEVRERLARP